MVTVTFDTHAFVKKLTAAGFTETQAEIVTEVIKEASAIDLSHLSTKEDVHREIRDLEIRLMKRGFATLAGQGTLIVALLKLL